MVTGGHITPAMATIEVLRKQHPDWRIVCVGRKFALEGETVESEEYRLVSDAGLKFLPIIAGRLKREGGVGAWVALGKIPIGFFQAIWYVMTERPDLIVSFGGYVALPVVIAGWMLRVRSVTHEQTRVPGLANKIIAHFSARTCVSFSDGVSGLGDHYLYTGLPLRNSVFTPPAKPTLTLPKEKLPIILIVGGSTGSVSMNERVYAAIPTLIQSYTVIHQVGRLSWEKAVAVRTALRRVAERYVIAPYLSESDYSWALHHAALVVGRSGANTVLEIAAVGKVAVFVPLPWAAGNEQYHNAVYLQNAGSAVIVPQPEFTAERLISSVAQCMKTRELRERAAQKLASTIPRDGAERLARVIEDLIH